MIAKVALWLRFIQIFRPNQQRQLYYRTTDKKKLRPVVHRQEAFDYMLEV